jgi:hypothetical protein
MRTLRSLAVSIITLLMAMWPATAVAQQVEFTPRSDEPAERRLSEFLDENAYTLWTRDTVLARGDTLHGNLLILESAARIAGTVTGDVFVVDGDLFLRPESLIDGDAVILGGGFYGSKLATITGELTYRPSDLYRVIPEAGGYVIHPTEDLPKPFRLHGLYGFEMPTYQRVDQVTLIWGATAQAVKWAWQPSLEGVVRLKTEGGDFQGTVKQYWYPTAMFKFGVEAERITRSNDTWIRKNFSNSLSFLFVGEDFRNYYDADRVAFAVKRSEESSWSPLLVLQWERASNLATQKQWSFLGDDDDMRPNPPIDEGDTWSLIIGVDLDRRTTTQRLRADLSLEAADSTVAGDFSYVFGQGSLSWDTPGFRAHRVELFALARGDFAGTLPGQRWSAFGGRGTLPTFDVLRFRGPRLLYGQVGYLIPIPQVSLGLLGDLNVFGRVAAGSTWGVGEEPGFESNLLAGLRLSLLEVWFAVNPDGGDTNFGARLRLPGDL